jgi:hypothetical protein
LLKKRDKPNKEDKVFLLVVNSSFLKIPLQTVFSPGLQIPLQSCQWVASRIDFQLLKYPSGLQGQDFLFL